MKMRTTLTGIGCALTVTACFGSGSGGGNLDRFIAGCDASTNLGKEFCECAGKNAREELSADGFAFLSATFDGDEQEMAELRRDLSPAEAIGAGMFMVTAYKDCAPTD